MSSLGDLRLGIDIGGTKTAVGLVAADGRVVALETAPSGRGADGVVGVAVGLVERLLAQHVAPGTRVTAIGACMPGLVDRDTGIVRHAVNLDVDEVDLAGGLRAATGLPVHVENDVKAAAVGAHHLVHAGQSEVLGYLNLGTGLAAAVVRDGAIDQGAGGVAGEIGHLPLADPSGGVRCGCGQLGCLETVASGGALQREWTGGDPFEAAERGDRRATKAVEMLCGGIGLAVQVLVLASGVDRVVIGGGLTGLGEPLAAGVRRSIAHREAQSPFLASLELGRHVDLLPPGTQPGVVGAALLAKVPVVAR